MTRSTMTTGLFTPVTLGGITFANRIAVSPMCQYSADDGRASPWHHVHLGTLALSGAALVMIEATAVEPAGRITPKCLSLHDDATQAALARAIGTCRAVAPARIGVQLAHAGRKASSAVPWDGGGPLTVEQGGWQPVAPSPLAWSDAAPVPDALDAAGIARVRGAFRAAAVRAREIGVDAVEIHAAHGYLLHEFLSPITNRRDDEYGGTLANRMRLLVEVVRDVRAVWPADRTLGVRLSATDWLEDGFTLDEAVTVASALKREGIDYVCASSGGIVARAPIPVGPGYQVELAARIRREAGIATQAVGMISDPVQADRIIANGEADMVALARAFLDDPRWAWHAADALGAAAAVPPQYQRARPPAWQKVREAERLAS